MRPSTDITSYRCMHCGDDFLQPSGGMNWWCSLPCKGHVLQYYGKAQRFKFDKEEQEYYEYLKTLPKDYKPDGVMAVHPNKYVRKEAAQWLKEK